jgi:hypothetical protein
MEQRVEVIKRWRSLLVRQRDAFKNYLDNLDLQKTEIENGDTEKLNARMENEQKILREIVTLEKAVLPFADLRKKPGKEINLLADNEIKDLNLSLDKLKSAAKERLSENKLLLEQALASKRIELKNLRSNPFGAKKSVYDSDNSSGALIDIQL